MDSSIVSPVGRESSRQTIGAQGSIRTRARERLSGGSREMVPHGPDADAYKGSEDHYVTVLAQQRTVQAIATLSTLMRSRNTPPATRARCAQILLEWGWPKPGSTAARDRRPVGSQSLHILIESAVNPGAQARTRVLVQSEEPSDAIDVPPSDP